MILPFICKFNCIFCIFLFFVWLLNKIFQCRQQLQLNMYQCKTKNDDIHPCKTIKISLILLLEYIYLLFLFLCCFTTGYSSTSGMYNATGWFCNNPSDTCSVLLDLCWCFPYNFAHTTLVPSISFSCGP